MAGVAFQLAFKTSDMNSLSLPIEIRKTNSALIGRLLSTETIDLPAGQYYAVASLPGGQRLLSRFSVTEPPSQSPLTVTLAPDPEDESPHEWEEMRHFLGRQNAQATIAEPQAPASPQPGRKRGGLRKDSEEGRVALAVGPQRSPFLRVFQGNVVMRTHVPVRPDDVLGVTQADPNRVMQFEVRGRNEPMIAQLVQPGGRVQNLALPVSGITYMKLVAGRDPEGEVRLEAYLENAVANMMLQYTGAGWSSTAEKATNVTSVRAEKLLMNKMADPIGAAIGAYAILRLGSIEHLHDWTTNLRFGFPWLPDGSAICGEHLARLGRFDEAFEAFCEVPSRGLPIFADGLFYTIERMKLYTSTRLKSRGRFDPSQAQHVADQLQPFAALVRRQRPICSYPGLDVAAPDTERVPGDVVNDGMDLAPWFPVGIAPPR